MIRLFCFFILSIQFFFSLAHSAENPDNSKHLSILTWSDYIDPKVVEEFTQQFNVKVDFTYFETDETRDDFLLRTDGAAYDLVLVNRDALITYQQHNWLEPVSINNIPNLKNIDKKWLSESDNLLYGIPYAWGTIGIAYRSDLVKNAPVNWMDLFQPDKELSGKILMIGHNRELIGMAAKALAYSVNTHKTQELAKTRQLLLQQKPHVKRYGYISLDKQSSLVKGEIWAAQVYNGDAIMLQQYQPAIKYVSPVEGSILWLDSWVVAKKSNNKQLAYQFLNFINNAKQAAQNTEFIAYATPNTAAEKILPDTFFKNTVIYPPSDSYKNLEAVELLPPRVQSKWNSIYNEVTN